MSASTSSTRLLARAARARRHAARRGARRLRGRAGRDATLRAARAPPAAARLPHVLEGVGPRRAALRLRVGAPGRRAAARAARARPRRQRARPGRRARGAALDRGAASRERARRSSPTQRARGRRGAARHAGRGRADPGQRPVDARSPASTAPSSPRAWSATTVHRPARRRDRRARAHPRLACTCPQHARAPACARSSSRRGGARMRRRPSGGSSLRPRRPCSSPWAAAPGRAPTGPRARVRRRRQHRPARRATRGSSRCRAAAAGRSSRPTACSPPGTASRTCASTTLRLYVGARKRQRGGYRYDGIAVRAVDVATHPGYRSLEGGGPANDVAILKLERPVAGVPPVHLGHARPTRRASRGGGDATVLGWGVTRTDLRDAPLATRPARGRAAPARATRLRPRSTATDGSYRAQRHALRAQPQRLPPAEHLAVRRRQRRPARRRRRPAGRHRELRDLVRRAARADRLLPRRRRCARSSTSPTRCGRRSRSAARRSPATIAPGATVDLRRRRRSASRVDRVRYRWGINGMLVATGRRVRITRSARRQGPPVPRRRRERRRHDAERARRAARARPAPA